MEASSTLHTFDDSSRLKPFPSVGLVTHFADVALTSCILPFSTLLNPEVYQGSTVSLEDYFIPTRKPPTQLQQAGRRAQHTSALVRSQNSCTEHPTWFKHPPPPAPPKSNREQQIIVTMASVIIITYGQRRHLIHKPNNYDSLLDIAFEKFPELEDVDDRDIAFNFTPEWFNGEVQVDRSAFSEVHARAILRITTTAVVHRGNDVKVKHEQV